MLIKPGKLYGLMFWLGTIYFWYWAGTELFWKDFKFLGPVGSMFWLFGMIAVCGIPIILCTIFFFYVAEIFYVPFKWFFSFFYRIYFYVSDQIEYRKLKKVSVEILPPEEESLIISKKVIVIPHMTDEEMYRDYY